MNDHGVTLGASGRGVAVAAPAHKTRPTPLRRAWRFVRSEPLVHFVVLGAIIFAADALLHPPDRSKRVIVVTRAMRQAMSDNFDEDRERKATASELNAMVENWVASEILFREGKALGLDRGDDAIRDRIAYKLQLLIFSQLDLPPATDTALRAWFADNHDRFDEPERCSFYVSPPFPEAIARGYLAEVQAGRDPAELQQATRAIVGRPVGSLSASFGDGFRDGLLALPIQAWSVLQSTDGWHVVRLDSRRAGIPARFEDNQDEVVRVWQTDQTRRRAWEAVQRLRANYAVRIEP